MTSRFARMFLSVVAMAFLTAASPSAYEPPAPEFNACSQCHEGKSDGWCAGLVINAIAACCGSMNQNAWAWCVNNEWGFFVRCEEPQQFDCQCNDMGGSCDRLLN